MLLDDEDKIENQTQTLDSVTQRLSQSETSLEDITSQVSMLKEDLSMIRRILRDDEDKIENHTQTVNSVTQEMSQFVTYLDEDLVPKVSGNFQKDDIRIKSHAQTLNSVTERLSECESSIQTMHSRYTLLMYKATDSSNALLERRFHATEEQSTSNNKNCREVADSRDLMNKKSNP